jgi:hypothetical protein
MSGEKKNNRWSTWARAITRRHVRFTERRDSLALIVLRLRGPLNIVRERWSFTTRIVRPHVHLAINAVLTQRRKGAKTDAKAERTFLRAFAPLREKTSSTTSRHELRTGHSMAEFERQTGFERQFRFERQTETSVKPLTFVFERINRTSSHSRSVEKLVHQHARSIVERVTQQSRRHETIHIGGGDTLITQHITATQMHVTQPRVMKTVTTPTRVIEKTIHEPPVTTVVETAAWLKNEVPVAGLNIDQITDQVVKQLDRRVVAARERMGRF